MTGMRRGASGIAEFVRTYASPGCVEWAETLEAEIAGAEYIDCGTPSFPTVDRCDR